MRGQGQHPEAKVKARTFKAKDLTFEAKAGTFEAKALWPCG